MLDKLWEILGSRQNLIETAKEESINMLKITREMFVMVVNALKEETSVEVKDQVSKMDKNINKKQQEIRKMVFEHLALSSGKDLLTGLQLTTIVIDLERIGDYTKNIGELVEMMPAKLEFEEYEETFTNIKDKTLEAFDLTYETWLNQDEEKAAIVLRDYHEISITCDGILKEMVTNRSHGDSVQKKYLGLALLARYIKRVNAHLKNISSVIINPFHKIGYRVGS